MEKQPDKPEDFTNEPLPSMSEPMEVQDAVASTSAMPFVQPIITASKSKAQKQREYRQRIAASITPAQAAAARKSKNERQRNNRLQQAAILATTFAEPITAAPKTRAQIQREYRQRIAASKTPAQAAAAREARNVRDRNNRLRQAANLAIASGSLEATTTSSSRSGQRLNSVHIDTQRQFTVQQCQTLATDPAETTLQPSTSSDQIEVQAQSTCFSKSCHYLYTESTESGPNDTSNFMTSENTLTLVADESMDYSIYRFKCNKIISNVYRYLQKEYVLLKSQLGGLCDVSVLSNTLARTAAATGVSQDEVEIALSEAALHSDQTSKPEETHYSAGVRRPRIIRCSKRRSKTLEEDDTDSLRAVKRKAINKNVLSKPRDEEQLPFPAPIQLRVHGVMETECKIEPVDEPPTMDDPLEAESSSHCGTAEEVEIEIKTEPVDYESPQNIKDEPLALEWSPTALEQPSDPPDFIEVKSEHVDHDHSDLFWYPPSMYDKKRPDINPKRPLQ